MNGQHYRPGHAKASKETGGDGKLSRRLFNVSAFIVQERPHTGHMQKCGGGYRVIRKQTGSR